MDGDMWKGMVTFGYWIGGTSTGFTSYNPIDIVKFIFDAKAEGNTTLKLTTFDATGFIAGDDYAEYLNTSIAVAEATTTIKVLIKYSKYDLNKDGKVSSLDLAIALLYVEFRDYESAWYTYTKVNNNLGEPIYPYMCDVTDDGVVNMIDLIDIMLKYTSVSVLL